MFSLPSSLTNLSTSFPDVLENLRDLAPRLTHLSLYDPNRTHFWNPSLFVSLPPSLTHLSIDCHNFDAPLASLPSSLTHLTVISGDFNRPLDLLPPSLTYLNIQSPCLTHKLNIYKFPDLNTLFNHSPPLTNDTCPKLTHLTLGTYFNQKIASLPFNLTHLTFGPNFNQKVNNLPLSLTHLTFGASFNQNIKNLPPHLTHLIFGTFFNKPLIKLPSSLLSLQLKEHFHSAHLFPPSLTSLSMKSGNFAEQEERKRVLFFPLNLQELSLSIGAKEVHLVLWQHKITF